MGTIANKLEYLNETKQMFKNDLNKIGAGIDSSTKFRDYKKLLDDIYEKSIENSRFEMLGRTSQVQTEANDQLFNIDGTVLEGTLVKYGDGGMKLTQGTNNFVKLELPQTLVSGTNYTLGLSIIENTLQADPTLTVSFYDDTLGESIYTQTVSASTNFFFQFSKDSANKISFSINAPEEDGAYIAINHIMLKEGAYSPTPILP